MRTDDLDAQFAALTREMLAAFSKAPEPAGVHVPDATRAQLADVEAVAVLFGWMNRVCRTAELALQGCDDGFEVESAPLVRSLIEHAVAIWWLEDRRGEAYQVLVRGRARAMELLERAQKDGWELDEESQVLLREAIEIETDEDTRSGDNMLHAAARASAYDLGAFHQGWLVETWSSHPTIMSAQPYFTVDAENSTVSLHAEPRSEAREAYAAIASAVHTALIGYDRVVEGVLKQELEDWQARFNDLGARLTAKNAAARRAAQRGPE